MHRVTLEVLGYRHNLGRHGRGKENGLTFLRDLRKNGLDVLAKAHVQHLVSLVEDNAAEVLELEGTPSHVVHNSAGSADNDVRTAFELEYLLLHARAAVDRAGLDDVLVLGEFAYFLISLHSELACGTEYQYGNCVPVLLGDALDSRKSEGSGLARAGVGASDDVPALEHEGNAFFLYLSHFREAELLNGAEYVL